MGSEQNGFQEVSGSEVDSCDFPFDLFGFESRIGSFAVSVELAVVLQNVRVTLVVRRCLPGESQLFICLQWAWRSFESFDTRSSIVVADDVPGALAGLAAATDSHNPDVSRTIVQKARLFVKCDDPCVAYLFFSLEDILSSGNDSDLDLMVNSIARECEPNGVWVLELIDLFLKNFRS